MKNEVDYIKSRVKREPSFTVPEGYFDTLTDKVMMRLPEKQKKTWRPRAWMYAAACLFFAVFSVTAYLNGNMQSSQPIASTQDNTMSENAYSDALLDYAMVDNQDIYACLTSEY